MRNIKLWPSLLFLFCFANGNSYSQGTLSAKTVKLNDSVFLLRIDLLPGTGFHVYADNPKETVEGPLFKPFSENIRVLKSKILPAPVVYRDPVFEKREVAIFRSTEALEITILIHATVPAKLYGNLVFFTGRENEFVPVELPVSVDMEGGKKARSVLSNLSVDLKHPLNNCGNEMKNEQSFLRVFLLGLLGGLVALFTPCVFPMIPVTVSYFTKTSKNRRTAIRNGTGYGLCILFIYVLASVPFHLIANVKPELLNNIATSVPLNIIFFAIFFVFALSFFGLFELRLPSSIATRTDAGSGLGSVGGIFFMALTLAVVSFSCTGPILGSLLVGSVSGGAWLLTAGLAGFGLALAMPFGLFAVFPQILKGIPKSGSWLGTFKVSLAFIELALAFKFLSNADLVAHWGLLKREVFLSIWILIAVCLAGYLIDLPWLVHYGRFRTTKGKAIGSITTLAFAGYLFTGLYGNTLNLLSGFAPPMSYSINQKNAQHHLVADVVNDYDKALVIARREHKNILIDFTGWACVNCRKMEEDVWTKPEVAAYIKEHFVLLSLYVDDKARLPAEDQTETILTVGDRWAKLEAQTFRQTTQPLYVVLNERQQLVTVPVGYTPDQEKYLKWLECGVNNK